MASLDDYLNLDNVDVSASAALPSVKDDLASLFSPALTDSPASPASVNTAFMPPNSPPQPQTALDTLNPNHAVFNELFRTYIEPLKASSSAFPAAALGEGAFSFADLFANYRNDSLFQPITASTGAAPASAVAPSPNPAFPFTIDPALVATPAIATPSSAIAPTQSDATSAPPAPEAPTVSNTAPRASTAASIADDDSDLDDDEDDDDLPPLPRGKKGGARKSTGGVAAGGIVKRTGATSCVVRDADSNDPDDWRPTPEEYKKLSSKEKRQLRNKISARNFRVRRKGACIALHPFHRSQC